MKSSAAGIDLEFAKDGARYLVAIKSGPNWGNSAQVQKMQADFANATRILRQGRPDAHVVAVNGCCYGQDVSPDKGNYIKLCGQEFWQLVSGDDEFYTRIIKPLGHRAASPQRGVLRPVFGRRQSVFHRVRRALLHCRWRNRLAASGRLHFGPRAPTVEAAAVCATASASTSALAASEPSGCGPTQTGHRPLGDQCQDSRPSGRRAARRQANGLATRSGIDWA